MPKVIVEKEDVGKRLDAAIFSFGFALSRTKAADLIKDGYVLVNGKKEKGHYLLEEGDEVTVENRDEAPERLEGEDIPLDVVYEDGDILIINKPAGLLVHPGNGNPNGTIANAIAYRYGYLPSGEAFRPGIVHRIDKDTSGLLAIAKSEKAFVSLSEQLFTHSMHREYQALVKGIIYEDDGKIDAPIGRDRKSPTKNAIDLRNGKEAVTFFHVEKRFYASDATLVSCRLLTGRTHQIRVHMEYIGHPVLGDPLYGSGNRKLYDKGQLLHAYKLTLTHPSNGKTMEFTAKLPPHFTSILESMEEKEKQG